MIRPFTCLSLVAALGAGLYLYQEKHRAQLLDREIGRTVHLADQARDRIILLKAESAVLNEPERLGGLAASHLQLQPLQPAQYARLEDLRSRLPGISVATAAPVVADEPLVAATVPTPVRSPLVMAQAASTPTPVVAPVPAVLAHPVAAPKPVAPRVLVAAKPREAEPAQIVAAASRPAYAPAPTRHLFAPVMPAFAPTPVVVHAPTVQVASAMSAPQPAPFVGSALGMAHSYLAAPVPMGSAAALGYATGR